VDLSLLDVQVAALANQAESYLVTGAPPRRLGNAHPSIVPYQAFPTADGHLVLAVGNDGQFARFCAVAGRPELAVDPRFATNAARVTARGELAGILAGLFATRATADWVAALEAADVPCGPINDLAQVFADPQVRHRGLRVEIPRAGAPPVPVVASPIRLSRTPVRYERPPPAVGEHTREILEEVLGMTGDEVAALRARGVV
jgi:crotonobetainyl-CoA:carnitine CoA-transferase CaiB-like acyl-CoA transferase